MENIGRFGKVKIIGLDQGFLNELLLCLLAEENMRLGAYLFYEKFKN